MPTTRRFADNSGEESPPEAVSGYGAHGKDTTGYAVIQQDTFSFDCLSAMPMRIIILNLTAVKGFT
eukprot:756399-Hanusia_phi.AAC.1